MERKTVIRSGQNVSGSIESYTIYSKVDIQSTGNYQDASQQNWDSLVTVISMRAQPVILGTPETVADLSTDSSLSGSGYKFTFSIEHAEAFSTHDSDYNVVDPVGAVKELLEGINLGGTTVALGTNMEIVYNG